MYEIKLRMNLIWLFHNSFVLIKTARLPFYDDKVDFPVGKTAFYLSVIT